MDSSQRLEQLLECLIHVVGRAAMPEQRVREIVGTGEKQVEAFNLCDGTRSQKEIATRVDLDEGNFSRSAGRWIENGVAFLVGEGNDARLLHIYPIPPASTKNRQATRKRPTQQPRQRQ